MRTQTTALVAALAASAPALAGVGPFTETFDADASNWLNGSFNPAAYDASGFISASADVSTAGEFGLTLFRGHDDFDASGDAFVGDYLTAGIDTISFDIRHDFSASPLAFALRVANANNSPAFVVLSGGPVFAGDWQTLTFDLNPGSPLYIPEGAPGFGFFAGVMADVGNLQVLVLPPDGLPDGSVVGFDLDNVATTPAPATAAPVLAGLLLASRRRR